ncbi:MAG: SDR family oxidoreductase [Flavobacteriales bacterium]|nr:SDR family oxidoreductase [Flavobacteriales bacterium]MCB9196225.1 SDR family oxidoreductase [Flavobacteriales bacterium]
MSNSLNIVVTGASKGIGFDLTKNLLSLGHRVFAISRNIDSLVQLKNQYFQLEAIQLDVTQDLSPIIGALQGLKIDHLINNAGYLVNKGIVDLTDQDILKQFEVNAIAPLRIIRELLPYFQLGGSICNITSMGGVQGTAKFPGLLAYSSSKGALSILTECLAEELSDHKIRCNALALGAVQTEMLEAAFPDYKAPFSSSEMAEYITTFVLETSRFYNGKVLPVSVSTP